MESVADAPQWSDRAKTSNAEIPATTAIKKPFGATSSTRATASTLTMAAVLIVAFERMRSSLRAFLVNNGTMRPVTITRMTTITSTATRSVRSCDSGSRPEVRRWRKTSHNHRRRQQGEEEEVAFALGEDDRQSHRRGENRNEREIGHAGDRRDGAAETDQPPDHPQTDQGRQKPAPGGGTAGPVLDRRQEEAGDDRHCKAEDHLVAVPGHALETRFTRHRLLIGQRPPRHRERRPQPTEKKKRSKALLKHDRYRHALCLHCVE